MYSKTQRLVAEYQEEHLLFANDFRGLLIFAQSPPFEQFFLRYQGVFITLFPGLQQSNVTLDKGMGLLDLSRAQQMSSGQRAIAPQQVMITEIVVIRSARPTERSNPFISSVRQFEAIQTIIGRGKS